MKIAILFCVSFLLVNCASSQKEDSARIDRLHELYDSIGSIQLPYKGHFGESTENSRYHFPSSPSDSVLWKEFEKLGGDIYFAGFLPDTTNYFGIVLISVASDSNIGLITLDKAGKRIDVKNLTEDQCYHTAGDVLFCDEHVTIDQELNINYSYNSTIVYEQADEKLDTVHSALEKSGFISHQGFIELK